jgi:hypothetical protein
VLVTRWSRRKGIFTSPPPRGKISLPASAGLVQQRPGADRCPWADTSVEQVRSGSTGLTFGDEMMTEKNKMLPKRWAEFLHKQPETGMGYQVVSLTLDDETRIENVAIIESQIIGEIKDQPDISFDPKRITAIEVTHRKWKFRR